MNHAEEVTNMHVQDEQVWENLKISNDFMFSKVMRNQEICKGMIEQLLDISIDQIEYPEEQKVIDISKDSKSVRLDVYLKDSKGTVYNIEIQTTSSKNLAKRTRFYQGMIDLNAIEKGADYSELPQSFVIFICTFDMFGEGRLRYTFQNICSENGSLFLKDGTTKIFFNTDGINGDVSKDAGNILKFIQGGAAEDDFTKSLEQEVKKIKENKEWMVEYMTLMMREREKFREGEIKGAVKACKNFNLSFEETVHYISENFNLSFKESEEAVSKEWA